MDYEAEGISLLQTQGALCSSSSSSYYCEYYYYYYLTTENPRLPGAQSGSTGPSFGA